MFSPSPVYATPFKVFSIPRISAVNHAKGPFHVLQKKESLADELLSADKDEVLKVLKAQEQDNHRMRQYIDMLLMLIMETDPSLLEKC